MNRNQAEEKLNTVERELTALWHAMGTLSTDGETAAPKESWRGRGRTMETLAGMEHRLLTDPAFGEALDTLLAEKDALEAVLLRRAEEFQELLEEMRLTPAEEYAENQRLASDASAVWHDAKLSGDYDAFAPYLEKLIAARRRFAERKDPDRPAYDVLLDRFERGASMETLDPFFDLVRRELTPLIREIAAMPQPRTDFLHRSYPVEKQRLLSDRVMALMWIDRGRCGIAETEHPFTDGSNKWDVRITTHYHEDDVASSLYSVIHEGGHALYEMGVGDELQFTILGGGSTMGIHESQSRFYENLIGRSEPFCRALWPILTEIFPEQLADVTVEEFYKGINQASPSLIRTEADELTYPLHVLVRYEMERRMIGREVPVKELPDLWNSLYREVLGVEVPNHTVGILQDSHWSGGAFGYFPSYALGSAYGVQILAAMEREVDVWGSVAAGDLAPVTAWLREHLHRYGKLLRPAELLRSAGVEPFEPRCYIGYLQRKFRGI